MVGLKQASEISKGPLVLIFSTRRFFLDTPEPIVYVNARSLNPNLKLNEYARPH